MSKSATTHKAEECGCGRCTIPLLQNLPPLPLKGKQARADRLQRILAEEVSWIREPTK